MSDNYPPGAFAVICKMERNAQNYDDLLKENKELTKWYYLECAKNDEPDLKGHKVCYHIIDEINEEQDAIRSCIRDVLKSIADGKSIHDFNSFELLVYKCFMRFVERDAELIMSSEFTEL
jgi:hypothetical protein